MAVARSDIVLRLSEVILKANNQNRYCTLHEYLHPGPLNSFLSCLVFSPEVNIVVQIDNSLTKNAYEEPWGHFSDYQPNQILFLQYFSIIWAIDQLCNLPSLVAII